MLKRAAKKGANIEIIVIKPAPAVSVLPTIKFPAPPVVAVDVHSWESSRGKTKDLRQIMGGKP